MSNPLQTRAEIAPLFFNRKFLLAYGAQPQQGRQVGIAYWNHELGSWVTTPEVATAFDTQAASLVYRRGNLQRMQWALDDRPAQQ